MLSILFDTLMQEGESFVETLYEPSVKVLTVRKPGVNLGSPWSIQL